MEMLEKKRYKNYKELCEALGWEVTNGNSKKKQMKELNMICKYEKEGYAFVIKEVYKQPTEQLDGGLFVGDIEILILDMLARAEGNTVSLTTKNLYRELELVNDTYVNHYTVEGKYKTLSEKLNVTHNMIKDVYYLVSRTNKRNTISALKKLTDKCLILWELRVNVCKIKEIEVEYDEEKGEEKVINVVKEYRYATEEEKSNIIATEHKIMKEMRVKNKRFFDINEEARVIFNERVKKYLLENYDIEFYYYTYDITYNKKDILEELNNTSKKEVSNRLNDKVLSSVYKQIDKVGEKTKNKYKVAFGEVNIPNDIERERYDESYERKAKNVAKAIVKRDHRKS